MNEDASKGKRTVRAVFRAITVPGKAPHNVATAKVYYPAIYSATETEKNTGMLPADTGGGPYPVAILMPGINVSPECYGWLAYKLAQAGFVSVIYGWIVEEMPGMVASSPGLDIVALNPKIYGKRPSATALSALIEDLAVQNKAGLLAGALDLDKILLGGHSAGGSVALFNALTAWFPGLRAAFAYGAHSKASTMLGYEPGTYLQLPNELPKLILGGGEDGVIAASAFRYGAKEGERGDPAEPVVTTFEKATTSKRGDCYLGIVKGANHFSLAWPQDDATGRPFLDWPTSRPDEEIRADLSAMIVAFAKAHVTRDPGSQAKLRALLEDRKRVQQSAIR